LYDESDYISTVLIQEYIPGDEVAVDGYVDNKALILTIL
jgi:hypothetical protein